MKQMPAGKFEARCLSVRDAVNTAVEPVVITIRGTPVAKVVPVTSRKQDFFGIMAGKFKVVGDIESPVISLEQREVMRN